MVIVAVAIAAVVLGLPHLWVAASSVPATEALGPGSSADGQGGSVRVDRARPVGSADGVIAGDVSVFSDVPAVANLDPALHAALRRAAVAARNDGVDIRVNSGWRSAAYQQRLLYQATATYGSAREAARWVASPARSSHVAGQAVDVGRRDATDWLSDHGAAYGLCQIYDNEPWHYELRPDAVDHGCPRRYTDAANDPRMR